MVSCSHWGLFERHYWIIPPGFELADNWQDEMFRSDGIVLIHKPDRR